MCFLAFLAPEVAGLASSSALEVAQRAMISASCVALWRLFSIMGKIEKCRFPTLWFCEVGSVTFLPSRETTGSEAFLHGDMVRHFHDLSLMFLFFRAFLFGLTVTVCVNEKQENKNGRSLRDPAL